MSPCRNCEAIKATAAKAYFCKTNWHLLATILPNKHASTLMNRVHLEKHSVDESPK